MNLIERWNNFSLREKQSLLIGGTALALFLLYAIIWAPLADKVTTLHEQVQRNHELLTWMQSADARIAELSKTPQTKHQDSNTSLLSIMQSQIKKSLVAQHVTQLRQAENNTVQLVLQKVDFDTLTTWLTMLWKDYNLIVVQSVVTPTGTVGEVNADLIVKAAS